MFLIDALIYTPRWGGIKCLPGEEMSAVQLLGLHPIGGGGG